MTLNKPLEFDLDNLMLDDLVALEDFAEGRISPRKFRAILGRSLTNWTEEEIGKLTLPEVRRISEALREEMKAMRGEAVPPANGGGSLPGHKGKGKSRRSG